mgnify:CR=1 FL=1
MSRIRIIDTTLRDGSHAISHAYTPQMVAGVAEALDKAGCGTIEISHGDGIGGSSYQYGFSKFDELELIAEAKRNIVNAKIAVLLLPGIGTVKRLEKAYEAGATTVRVATHVTEADTAHQHILYAKKIGMEAIGFLMMTHMAEPEKILEQAKLMESYGADCLYCADSAGAMLPDDVKRRIGLLKQNLSIPVGFHAHNNLGLAIGNSLAAVEAGADCLDSTLMGIGASAGNAQHEVLAAVMQKAGIETGEDLNLLMDAAEDIVANYLNRPIIIDKYALTIGYAGVYGSFFLHAKRAAEKFGLDARDILVELGRMKTVGGQEDMIVDVAYRMQKQKHAEKTGVEL